MIRLSEREIRLHEVAAPNFARVFRCVADDMQAVEKHLGATLRDTQDALVRQIAEFLLEAPGKRIRPALVLLSARAAGAASNGSARPRSDWMNVAAAMELIHMASLVHDDLIDNGTIRHHRATIHAKWGRRVSVFVGNHLCAKAFQLVAQCADPRLFAILGAQLCAMCEGEIRQVADRGDFQMSARRCLTLAEKKTAALFVACSGAGAVLAMAKPETCKALQEFGLHFGIAFQILDDCRDLLSDEKGLGKTPGQDLLAGDVTLPLLYLLRQHRRHEKQPLRGGSFTLGTQRLAGVSETLLSSRASERIARVIASQVDRARHEIQPLPESKFKESLGRLADQIAAAAAGLLTQRTLGARENSEVGEFLDDVKARRDSRGW